MLFSKEKFENIRSIYRMEVERLPDKYRENEIDRYLVEREGELDQVIERLICREPNKLKERVIN